MAKKKIKKTKTTSKKVVRKKKKKKVNLFEKWGLFQQVVDFENKPYFPRIFTAALAVTAIMMLTMSFDFGISGDETDMHHYGQDLVNYYTSFGEDRKFEEHSSYNPNGILKYYGGLFDMLAEGINSVVKPDDVFAVRHFITAIFGFLGILFAALLAYRIGGYPMAFATLVFLVLSPRFMGHAMNNTKDIPFASTYIAGIYFIVRYLQQIEKANWKTIVPALIAVGCCINTRAGGILLIPFLLLFVAIEAVLRYPQLLQSIKKKNYAALRPYGLYPLLIAFGGYLFSSLLWPYALENPIANPVKALQTLSEYPVFITCLFEGERLNSSQLPWYYIPKWMWMTVPVVVIAGFFAGLVMLIRGLKYQQTKYAIYVAITAILPVGYAIIQRSNLYDGWRHFIFVYPSIVVTAAFGWAALYRELNKQSKNLGYGVIALALVGLLNPLIWSIRNYPNWPVYFNIMSGGIDSKQGQYELDYYMNSIKQACEWLEDNVDLSDSLVIATTTSQQVKHYLRDWPNIKIIYTRYYERYDKGKWDYAIYYNRFLNPWQLQNGVYPTSEAIHAVAVDGVPLVAIYKDENGYTHAGQQALNQNRPNEAIDLFSKEIELHPDNEIALRSLGSLYLNAGNMDMAKQILDQLLSVHKRDIQGINLLGTYYLRQNEAKKAVELYEEAIRDDPSNYLAYYSLGQIQASTQNWAAAFEYLKNSIRIQPRFQAAYQLAIRCLDQMGQTQLANSYREALKGIR